VLRTIVEGEPGVFPEPVARLMRGIGGIFRRKPKDTGPMTEDAAPPASPVPPDAPREGRGGGPDAGPGQSGDST
jgi:hypothetical protein